ncbi:Sugar phosphate transporter domain [Arabidopsis thaliana x Arabidopsis arenosa]|uniref:Sugar phosphate transporter domain n=2 Tax=Arabidopsis thaliana x Arabidopsis arenosa TaxID=1240361 RepID=A0A8T1XIX7_9BRAS|nr:Sugar phosphate transporter domain [Arabidopsis thaliana x Arabidopsis arenosa]
MLLTPKMFSSWLRKDVKKILKRKDSDAGERGKALEDLRASLFNRFRSPDTPKRQQQQQHRICGPTVALTFNFIVAISIIFVNKWVLKNIGFEFPVFLTFIHYIVAYLLMALLKSFSLLPASPPSTKSSSLPLYTLGIVMSLSTGLANVSLKYNSVGFYQMAKIAVTPSIVFAEFLWYRKRVSFMKVVALTVVSVGVAVATVTDLQFSLFGACVAFAWIIPSATNKILWSNMQQRENWTALALMWKTTPITLLFLVSMIPFLDPPGALSFNWSYANTSAILVSALLGFFLQWSGALALGATSAITHVVLGQFKTCVLLLGNYYIFGSNSGLISVCGAFVAIMGTSLYTYLNTRGPSLKASSSSSALSDKKSRFSDLKDDDKSLEPYGSEAV